MSTGVLDSAGVACVVNMTLYRIGSACGRVSFDALEDVTSDAADGPDRHQVQVELRRQLCTKTVPFTVIKLADGSWLVNQVDLTTAGTPTKPCLPGNEPDTTARH